MAKRRDTPTQPSSLATLYGQWAFNFLVDVAAAIADDSVERPSHYRTVSADVAAVLSGFRSLVGSHPDWPDADQRTSAFRVLGPPCLAAVPVREAALIYVEAGTEANRDMLLEAFRDTVVAFRNQLSTIDEPSLGIACRQIGFIFASAVKLLSTAEVARVFDLPPAPPTGWPFGESFRGEGAHLVTELVTSLECQNIARVAAGGPNRPLNISMRVTKFSLLQRAAFYGASAISEALARSDDDAAMIGLVGSSYKWAKALQGLMPDPVRVWKDGQYKSGLTDLERGLVGPHPSGELSSLVAVSPTLGEHISTATVSGEVCCSSGALASCNCEVSPGVSSCAGFCSVIET
jgi:hypothetical protein